MMQQPTFKSFGKHAVLLTWKLAITEDIHLEVEQWNAFLSEIFFNEIVETVPTYQALAIYLKPFYTSEDFIRKFRKLDVSFNSIISPSNFTYNIPVCYTGEYAPDISEVAKQHHVSVSEVICHHTAPEYLVYFLGFLPGFPYLGGLSEKLYTPRKNKPRRLVRAGSVGIGGKQTGIYTQNSPGGWNIIGASPLHFFNPLRSSPALLKSGDRIKFTAISEIEFKEIEEAVKQDNYTIQKEVRND
ncbi:5-oxoprolinase subunit PxpB [Cochleicola gelatinilyticus]|uniref:Carboxyltransferase domain-containing protein n=1 Tax=Cochleicola gelatinilyticus TaxID=1763537 RepID=A0A167HNL6_9FLAO|nr:5-oxoprolinase subunit PxpB [Cochleicola gelatinilyticus]OAB78800.1 hypothetical protein ULVI_09470 [Cochleicola gelatinilyticus]